MVYTCPENIVFLKLCLGGVLSACLERAWQGRPLRSPPEFTVYVNRISSLGTPFVVSYQERWASSQKRACS